MLGSGGVDRFGLDITIREFRVSTNTFMLLLKDAIVRPSLNSWFSLCTFVLSVDPTGFSVHFYAS